jgi:hypothetical protein
MVKLLLFKSRSEPPACGSAAILWNIADVGELVAPVHQLLRKQMKLKIVLAVCAAVTATTAMAQTDAAKSGPNNNAVNSAGQNNSNAPVAGRNSFTEGQAKSRIEGAGYTNVSALEKDANGVWRGKGSKGGTTSNVSVDFEGNVNPAK